MPGNAVATSELKMVCNVHGILHFSTDYLLSHLSLLFYGKVTTVKKKNITGLISNKSNIKCHILKHGKADDISE